MGFSEKAVDTLGSIPFRPKADGGLTHPGQRHNLASRPPLIPPDDNPGTQREYPGDTLSFGNGDQLRTRLIRQHSTLDNGHRHIIV